MDSDTAPSFSFNIIDDPWLDVLWTDGTPATLSLRELLANAHRVACLSESSPLTEAALLRFLIALVSDGLRDLVPTERDVKPFTQKCQNGMPAEVLDAILAPLNGRSNVLDPEHDAFFDGPEFGRLEALGLASSCMRPASELLPEMPTDTNLAHFRHVYDSECPLCTACLLKGRFTEDTFAAYGGRAGISGEYKKGTFSEGKVLVIPVGQSLLTTLFANLIVGDISRPSWISIHTNPDVKPGILSILSWRPRLISPAVPTITSASCKRCGSNTRHCFLKIKYGDTYTHKHSRFGSKDAVDKWKQMGGDPHVIPTVNDSVKVPDKRHDPAAWPLRALTRLLTSDTGTILDHLPHRTPLLGLVTLTTTSTTGKQAKIDNAPHAALAVPLTLLTRPPEDRKRIAAALETLFEKSHQQDCETLIPRMVPSLLSDLAVAENPDKSVDVWLEHGKSHVRSSRDLLLDQGPTETGPHAQSPHTDPLRKVARRLINRLSRLSHEQLAALRPPGKGGTHSPASRQESFEAVWHGLPSGYGSKRHALREALARVGPLYAIYFHAHCPSATHRSFENLLRCGLRSEGFSSTGFHQDQEMSFYTLVFRLVNSGPASRDDLLTRVVSAIVNGGPRRKSRTIDFADLLLAVARWNDPVDPTPARWKRVLHSTTSADLSR